MFPPFNEELAKTECFSLMEKLDFYQTIDFFAIENNKMPNPKLSINHLYDKNLGIMFGILVCLDNEGKQHILKAFSGQLGSTISKDSAMGFSIDSANQLATARLKLSMSSSKMTDAEKQLA